MGHRLIQHFGTQNDSCNVITKSDTVSRATGAKWLHVCSQPHTKQLISFFAGTNSDCSYSPIYLQLPPATVSTTTSLSLLLTFTRHQLMFWIHCHCTKTKVTSMTLPQEDISLTVRCDSAEPCCLHLPSQSSPQCPFLSCSAHLSAYRSVPSAHV